MEHKESLNVDYPSWGETIEEEADLLDDTPDNDSLMEINFDEAKDEQMKETAKRIFELDESDDSLLEDEADFLLMEESEEILDEIFRETQEEQLELNKIMDLTRSKSTGLSLEMVDKLKEAAPGVFETDTKKLNLPQANSLVIDNEEDIVDLMVIMTRHSTPTGTPGPSRKVLEERQRAKFLREQQLAKEERDRLAREQRKREARAERLDAERLEAERLEAERLEAERLEAERLAREAEEALKVEELEIPVEEEMDLLIEGDGDLLEELQEGIYPEPDLYEEDTLSTPQIVEDEFEEDESSTYSLKELKKKVVIPEDTIM